MTFQLAITPCSWGVEYPITAHNPRGKRCSMLNKIHYQGWITIEQERDSGSLADIKQSRDFLTTLGLLFL